MPCLCLTLLLGLLFGGGTASKHHAPSLDVDIPDLPTEFFEDILPFLNCLDGNCDFESFATSQTPTPSHHDQSKAHAKHHSHATNAPAIHAVPPIRTPAPSNFEGPISTDVSICQAFFKLFQELEVKFPHLKALKSQLVSYLGVLKSSYEGNPFQRKEIALDVISSIIKLLKQLKKRIHTCPEPVPVVSVPPVEEIIAEEIEYPPYVGSVKGIPGVHYPSYTEVPVNDFTCADKEYIPGFYADMETRCQVFHVCYFHRRESFLCPVGTVFNQPILACDYWYNSNCSQSPLYYDVNEAKPDPVHIPEKSKKEIEHLITTIIEQDKPALPKVLVKSKDISSELDEVLKFLPIKAKVTEFMDPKLVEAALPKMIAHAKTATPKSKLSGKEKAAAKQFISMGKPLVKVKAEDLLKIAATIPVTKAKAAAAPIVAAKTVAKAASVPLVKAKVASVAAKKLPIIKSALGVDAKLMASAKAKKAVMISPLTKKALALGYLKLLKAKKLAMMG